MLSRSLHARWLWPATPLVIAACLGQTHAEAPAHEEVSTPAALEHATDPHENAAALAPATRTEEGRQGGLSATERALAAWIESEAHLVVRVGAAGHGGSGTLVSRDGHVLTAAHVVDGHRSVEVVLPDGRHSPAQVLRRDETRDLALLATGLASEHCARPADAGPATGDWILVSGFAGAVTGELPPSVSLGLMLGMSLLPPSDAAGEAHRPAVSRPALLTGARVAPGMSGGPALDARGRLVGVVAALGGRIAPIDGTSILEGIVCDAAPTDHALPAVIREATHDEPDRAASLAVLFEPLALAFDPDRLDRMQVASTVRFHASMGVYLEGVVVGPELVLTLADRSFGTVAEPGVGVTVVSHPGATVIGPVAISGELALVRVEHLDAPAIDARHAPPRVGELLASREQQEPGVVSALAVAPGTLAPFIPLPPGRHCGTLLAMRYDNAPRVEIARAFAHDVSASRGELLVDVAGRPVAIHVGHHVEGLGYAVPLSEARARFEGELAGR